MRPPISSLKNAFLSRVQQRWALAQPVRCLGILRALSGLFDQFHLQHLADPHFAKLLAHGSDLEHQQRVAEMLLAKHLWDHGFSLTSTRVGPDFKASKDGYSVWVELVTPEPKGIDPAWLSTAHQDGVWTYPHEAIALRYTSALKEKHEKLVGRKGSKPGYLAQGIVDYGEPYVIAINQHLLHGRCPSLEGISQVPVAGEVVYAIGPQQLHLSAATGQVVHADHSHRPLLEKLKPSGGFVGVPADSFLNPAYDPVSAVWALDLQEAALLPRSKVRPPSVHLAAMIHNARATARVPSHFLPSQEDWIGMVTPSSITLKRL